MNKIVNVLCVSDFFLPGFLAGGPIRTIDNMRKLLAGRVNLSVFTRDRDLGSDATYSGIKTNQWIESSGGSIYYASPDAFGPRGLRQVLASRDFDIVYLNSFFSPRASIYPCLALRWGAHKQRVLLAPRGEFSPGALAVKHFKKRAFLALARLLGLYRDVYWHASTQMEEADILRLFPSANGRIYVASDPVIASPLDAISSPLPKKVGRLRIAFISRISPKKNLDGLIRILMTIRAPIDLDIFGPIEDETYWNQCQKEIAKLPDNIHVSSHGPISPEMVSSTFARHDLFAFPTHGENFGHVIYEALRVGTPVLISDQTPWLPDASGAVTAIPLDDVDSWRTAIQVAAAATVEQYNMRRMAAFEYAKQYIASSATADENLRMFQLVASEDTGPAFLNN